MLEVGRECKMSRLWLVNDAVSPIVGRFAKMLRFSGVETPARYGKTLRTRSEQSIRIRLWIRTMDGQ